MSYTWNKYLDVVKAAIGYIIRHVYVNIIIATGSIVSAISHSERVNKKKTVLHTDWKERRNKST